MKLQDRVITLGRRSIRSNFFYLSFFLFCFRLSFSPQSLVYVIESSNTKRLYMATSARVLFETHVSSFIIFLLLFLLCWIGPVANGAVVLMELAMMEKREKGTSFNKSYGNVFNSIYSTASNEEKTGTLKGRCYSKHNCLPGRDLTIINF